MNLLKKIFSITDTTYRTEYRIFGVKLSIAKKKYRNIRKNNPYYFYKKNNIDITTIPSATGQLRDFQLASLVLLKELDYVCKQNNLKYWLDFGTLLGAVRHKGFIPWDDDIDTSMLRDDYDKIIDAFKSSSRNSDIYAEYTRTGGCTCQYFIKVKHKKCPYIFVDIFPWDYYGKTLSLNEQINETKRMKKIRNKMNKMSSYDDSNEKIKKLTEQARKEALIFNTNNSIKKEDLVWGIDFDHHWENWFTPYKLLEPLIDIEFEGYKFPIMNNPDYILTKIFGNYMSYPPKISFGHNSYIELTEEEHLLLKEIAKNSEAQD